MCELLTPGANGLVSRPGARPDISSIKSFTVARNTALASCDSEEIVSKQFSRGAVCVSNVRRC